MSFRARILKETEIWQRTWGREGRQPFAPEGVDNPNSNSKLLLPSTIYLVLNLAAAHTQAQKRERLTAAGAVGSDAGQGEQAGEAREGEEYEVERS